MRLPPAKAPDREAGFALIEILVSALIVVIVGGGVLTLLQSTTRSAGDQRRHATAFALAQEDQSRLRTSRLATLNNLEQQRSVVVDGQTYTVESLGVFVNGATGSASCTEGYESADYAKATSVVTWNGSREPVRIDSIVAPSSGSLDPTHGTLTISATNAAGEPLAGVSLAGTGAGTFSGSTDESGCANFADLPEGNYTLTTSANGLVDENGDTIGSRVVGVVASSTQTVLLRFDNPGTANIHFENRVEDSSSFEPAEIDSLYVFHPELSPGVAKGDPGGTRVTDLSTSLFPFTSPYTVYAGSCTTANPNPKEEEGAPGEDAMAGVTVPPGGSVAATIKVPALYVTVKDGSSLVQGAQVVITDDECKAGGSYVEREYVSNDEGRQANPDPDSDEKTEPALPWGRYNVCARAYTSGYWRRQRAYNIDVKSLASGTYVTLDLTGSGSNSSSYSGSSYVKC
ncbi:MAG: hypothetical protein R2725_15075 [Solirubrobacterales bacterium]